METKLQGKALVLGKNIDTDQIFPGRFLEIVDPVEIGKRCLYGVDPEIAARFPKGGIVVAGTNFGCGSSREHAAIALINMGAAAVIAESFARIFFRNGINLALPLINCAGITAQVQNGDTLSLDLIAGTIYISRNGGTCHFPPMGDHALSILRAGGIKPLFRRKFMAGDVVYESFEKMEAFMKEVFIKAGVPPEDAAVCAEVLIESDKRGIDSHGMGRFKPIYIDRIKDGIQNPVTQFEIVKDRCATAVVDGHDGMGQVIGVKSMQMAIDKAKQYGMGMVAARNSTHYGIAGYYATMATKAGMIGITGTNARPSIAPTFGIENMLGTNPLTVGIPSDEDFPFVLDCATSVSQRGKIEHYDRIGKTMPSGWVINCDGSAETDPAKALAGLTQGSSALAPLGGLGEDTAGYKGYGYATVVEILCAALQQGPFLKALNGLDAGGKKVPYRLGHFFIAIDVSAFTELEGFKKTTGDILRELRASAKMPGQDRIYTAGEKEYLAWLERKDSGLPLNESLRKTIKALQAEYALDNFTFDF